MVKNSPLKRYLYLLFFILVADSEDCCSCSETSSGSNNCSYLEIKDEQIDHRISSTSVMVKPPLMRTSFASVARLTSSASQSLQAQSKNQNLSEPSKRVQPIENAQLGKEKVKFSNMITQIPLPEAQEESSVSNSSSVSQAGNILTNFHISPNSNLHKNIPSEIAQELLRQSGKHESTIISVKSCMCNDVGT